jgi:hypothetical protein
MKYVFQYSEIKSMTLRSFCDEIRKETTGKKLNDFLMKDLIIDSEADGIIFPGTGVYFFKDETDRMVYAGKASSRSFTERISSHFDPRENAWFNSLIKHRNYPSSENPIQNSLEFKARYAYEKLSLVLVNFDVETDKIGRFEGMARASFDDLTNKTKRETSENDFTKTIENLLS